MLQRDSGLWGLRVCFAWAESFVRHDASLLSMRSLLGRCRKLLWGPPNRCCRISGVIAGRWQSSAQWSGSVHHHRRRAHQRLCVTAPAAVIRESGCQPHAAASSFVLRPGCSTNYTDRSSTDSAPAGTWIGPPRSSTPHTCGRKRHSRGLRSQAADDSVARDVPTRSFRRSRCGSGGNHARCRRASWPTAVRQSRDRDHGRVIWCRGRGCRECRLRLKFEQVFRGGF